METGNSLRTLVDALQKVTSIREAVCQLQDIVAQPRTPEVAADLQATLQDVHASVTNLQGSWGHVQEALGQARQRAAAPAAEVSAASAPSPSAWAASAAARMEIALCTRTQLPDHSQTRKRQRTDAGSAGAPGQESGPPQRPGAAPPELVRQLHELVERVRGAAPGMIIHMVSQAGTVGVAAKEAVEVRLAYPKVLCASIALSGCGRPEAVRVVVDAFDRATDAEPWGIPQLQTFRRLSAFATRALAFFQHRARTAAYLGLAASLPAAAAPGASQGQQQQASNGRQQASDAAALEDLLLWLTSYRDLFTRPCTASGKLLAWEAASLVPLPPVMRPFMLTRQELLRIASEPSAIQAYHMHTAPKELLRTWGSAEPAFAVDVI